MQQEVFNYFKRVIATEKKKLPQWAIHGQVTFKQRYFNIYNVYTTLFHRRFTMMCPRCGDVVKFVTEFMLQHKIKRNYRGLSPIRSFQSTWMVNTERRRRKREV